MLKLFDSTGFAGVLSSADISKALGPLVSEGAKAWIQAESGAMSVAAVSSASAPFLQIESEEVPAQLVAAQPMQWRRFERLDGKLSHFQRKVANEVRRIKSSSDASNSQAAAERSTALQELPDSPQIISTRKTKLQKNVEWRNEGRLKKNLDERFKAAMKEATTLFQKKKLDPSSDRRSQQSIIDELNDDYKLTGLDKENTREKKRLSLTTVKRYVKLGLVNSTPLKKGKTPEISRNWMELIAVHINICQVSTIGELDIHTMKATMAASLLGTEWEDAFNMDYAWETIRREHAKTLIPAGRRAADDIRWHWVTYGNVAQFFEDVKVSYAMQSN